MEKILVFTATYNEKENIEKLVYEIFRSNKNLDIYVIDDNSPDGTATILEKISKNNDNFYYKIRESKLGLNTAHILAYDYAKENNYDKLITLDADFSHDPAEIPKIIDLLNKYDFVIGSRYAEGGKNIQPFFRYLISYFGNKLIRTLLRIKMKEFTTSYRGFNLNKLKNFDLKIVKGKGYSFFMETVVRINRLGFSCVEFPIKFKDRKYGKSKIPKTEIFRTLKNLIYLSFEK